MDNPNPPSTQENILRKYYRKLVNLGYSPIGTHPIGTVIEGTERDKSPVLFRWQEFCDRPATRREINMTLELQPNAQVGICGGFQGFCSLDVDTEDKHLQKIIQDTLKSLTAPAPLRKGKRSRLGAFLFVWEDADEIPPWLRFVDGANETIFELLGHGRQIVMPPSMHKSGVPYEFDDGEILPPPIADLPLLNMQHINTIVAAVRDAGYAIKQLSTGSHERPTPEELTVYEKLINNKKLVREVREYLEKHATISHQGRRGHDNACSVFHRCVDLGCTEQQAVSMMWAYWNDRNKPPWGTYESLEAELAGLMNSRRSPIGVNSRHRLTAQYYEEPEATASSGGGQGAEPSDEGVNDSREGGSEAAGYWSGTKSILSDNNSAIVGVPSLIKSAEHGVVLPKTGVAMIGGQSGTGKTFVVINLAVALTTEKEFFGLAVKERVAVLVIAGEGQSDILGRIRAARSSLGIEDPLPVFWLADIPSEGIAEAEVAAALTELINALNRRTQKQYGIRIGVIIVDTVAATVNVEDENSNAEISKITRTLRKMSEDTGALVLPVHHFGKNVESGPRGASAWLGNIDMMFGISRESDVFKLAIYKNRFGSTGEVGDFELHKHNVGVDVDGDVISTCWVRPIVTEEAKNIARGEKETKTKIDDATLLAISDCGDMVTKAEIGRATGWSERRVRTSIKRLRDNRMVTEVERGGRCSLTAKGKAVVRKYRDEELRRSAQLREEAIKQKRNE